MNEFAVPRRKLAEAAAALAEFRRAAGAPFDPNAPSTVWQAPIEAGVAAALEAAESRAERAEERLAQAEARAGQAESSAAAAGERARVLEAECARLEAALRTAERAAAEAESAARAAKAESPLVRAVEEFPPSEEIPEEPVEPPAFVSPPLEPLLDPGWSRLLRLVRPPVEAAYAHLRRLSATALTAGQKALLRLAAASIAQASDAIASIELALKEGPAAAGPTPLLPLLEESLSAWEPAFRRQGVVLAREWSAPLPAAVHEPKEARVLFYHVLRNALEALPRSSRLAVRASAGQDGGLRVEFHDDGPGFPAEWLERRFEPFAAPRRGRAGLGLFLVRRTLRRWGGEADAVNGPSGRGARLILAFAPPAPPAPVVK